MQLLHENLFTFCNRMGLFYCKGQKCQLAFNSLQCEGRKQTSVLACFFFVLASEVEKVRLRLTRLRLVPITIVDSDFVVECFAG